MTLYIFWFVKLFAHFILQKENIDNLFASGIEWRVKNW